MSAEAHHKRYLDAMHAMQSGVAYRKDKGDQEPKHLRVGVNAAMIESSNLAKLLIAKGIFTEEEFMEGLANCAEAEVALYEEELEKEYGTKVTLK